MVDLANLSGRELRDMLIKYEGDAPPVTANTRGAIESILKRHIGNVGAVEATGTENESANLTPVTSESPKESPPRVTVRFVPEATRLHEYDRDSYPSYCRRPLNHYRELNDADGDVRPTPSDTDSPKYNVLGYPGYTPHANKLSRFPIEDKKPSKEKPKSNWKTRVLILLLLIVLSIIGVYLLLNWDPMFHNPINQVSGGQ